MEVYPIEMMNIDLDYENERLQKQVRIFSEKEIRVLRANGVRDGMTILDIGCGNGWFTRRLCDTFPHSTIYGIDGNKELLSLCQTYQSDYVEKGQLKLFYGKIGELIPRLPRQFDVIVVRLVIQHLLKPEKEMLLTESFQLLSSNGLYFIITADSNSFDVIKPDLSGVPYFNHLISQYGAMSDKDKDLDFLTTLPRQLVSHGFTFIDVDTITVHSDSEKSTLSDFLLHPKQYYGTVRQGLVTEEQFERAVREYNVFVNKNVLVVSYLTMFTAKKLHHFAPENSNCTIF